MTDHVLSAPIASGYGHIGAATHVREYEDRHFAGTVYTMGGLPITLAIVADGVGGGSLGQRAAQLTVDAIVEYCQNASLAQVSEAGDIVMLLGRAIGEANRLVYDEGQENRDRSEMSSTAAVAAIVNNSLYVVNVGDSRVYLLRDKRLIQLTVDHTWAYERYRDGTLTKEESERHPNAHMISRSVGYQPKVRVDLGLYLQDGSENGQTAYHQQGLLLDANDLVLVCSDGLIKPIYQGSGYYASPEEVRDVLKRTAAKGAAKSLVDLAVSRDADDNVTAVVVEMPGRAKPFFRLPKLQFGAPAAAIISITVCLLLTMALVVGPGLLPDPPIPTPRPGFAYVAEGRVEHSRTPGSAFVPIEERTEIPFGAGSFMRVNDGVATLSLPGGYLIKVAGTQEKPTLIELFQGVGMGGATENILRLEDGSIFIFPISDSTGGSEFVLDTISGRARINGGIMGARFNSINWVFEVDCVSGPCILETSAESMSLLEMQRSWVDSSGAPKQPVMVNLDAYPEYYPMDFIDRQILKSITETFLPPAPTDTPNPTPTNTPTITLTPTPTATRTPKPTRPEPTAPQPTSTAPRPTKKPPPEVFPTPSALPPPDL